jgi:hypothetical protein
MNLRRVKIIVITSFGVQGPAAVVVAECLRTGGTLARHAPDVKKNLVKQ